MQETTMIEPLSLTIIGTITMIAVLFAIALMFTHVIRRIIRKFKGLVVSPMSLIIKKVFKYWLITAAILMPISAVLTYSRLNAIGASEGDIVTAIMLGSIMGNILTSLFVGYLWMVFNKSNWSYSQDTRNIRH